MNDRAPGRKPNAGAESGSDASAAETRTARWLIAALLLATAALDLTRCGLAASAPQAAASGFGAPYTIPDTATVTFGILLAVAVLATVGPTGPGQPPVNKCPIDKDASR